ncbi:MAG: aldehyde dehydrogenase family protein [Cyclobacteriaceae bacterium]|nr:aldehyde dehydrogenase family protein [Cyclobacteriaceae bacterium]MCB0498266.1 aldehyde dehydrogenase family protein [Cyclobacteriaceae bacterium]MCB9238990.1 aldehyde dehydrogenase family protein [Flammeovirgaceae bacterium]MCO5270713.1 aldehyde dehydrogenase family protein [Cyclobacteriaceae bacterium]MCW5900850.1 aldehyde dehydrogenase family protein [Cyclobacteriaceae bacterium]
MKNFGIKEALKALGIKGSNPGVSTGQKWLASRGPVLESYSPADGKPIGKVKSCDPKTFEKVVGQAQAAFMEWRMVPAPRRGEIVRQIGVALRKYKEPLGKLVSYEMGKSYQEGLGEVQEMIDICDFAVGLSRQLNGLTMHSERPSHRMYEQYHPLGAVGIISAFNFPVAVWSWNAMVAWVCGDTCIWKPSEKTPLCGVACQNIVSAVFRKNQVPEGVSCLVNGDYKIGQLMASSEKIPLVSATGSIRMGKAVAKSVAERLGKPLLELGGNNAIIISENANLDIAIRGALFGAVGTAGQRCTSTRRLIVQDEVYEEVKHRLKNAYEKLKIGNPLNPENHVGPLIDKQAVKLYQAALKEIKKEGGTFVVNGGVLKGKGYESGCYVKPAIAEVRNDYQIVQEETFAPILYLIRYKDLKEAIGYQNGVKQGLSSAIMTNNLQEMEQFLAHSGSDCGIANVNIGTSGAEIGGAFGGEKETGGGRESGSDAWKVYMRRQTNTINFGNDLPLAQGIKFDI